MHRSSPGCGRFADMSQVGDDGWWAACTEDLHDALAGDRTAAFVVDAPDGAGLVWLVIGTLDSRLTGLGRPRPPSARRCCRAGGPNAYGPALAHLCTYMRLPVAGGPHLCA